VKKWNLAGAVVLLAIAVATLQTGAAGRLKIGFVYLGPIGDFGWTYQHVDPPCRLDPAAGADDGKLFA
jgi:basic membrane lipoprotein Med (substrate-binding protein (PBP1-ABC) superfamily)